MGYVRPTRISPRLLRIILPAILVLTGLSTIFVWRDYTKSRADTVTQIGVSAGAVAKNLDRYLHDRFEVLTALGSSPVFQSGQPEAIAARVRTLEAATSGFDAGIMWIDAQGRVQGATDALQRFGGNVGGFRAVAAVLRSRIPSIQTLHGAELDNPMLLIAVPTVDERGLLNGVLAGSMRLDELRRLGPTLNLHDSVLTIADPDDHLIVGGSLSRLASVAEQAPYALMYADRAGALRDVTDMRGRPRMVVGFATVQAARWLVNVSQPTATAFRAARRTLIAELSLLGALALGAMGTALMEARRVRRLRRADQQRRLSAARLRIAASRLISAGERETVGAAVSEAIRDELGVPWCAILDTTDVAATQVIASAGRLPEAVTGLPIDATTLDRSLTADGINLTELPTPAGDPSLRLMAVAIGHRTDGLVAILPLEPGRTLQDGERAAVAALVESAVQAFDRARLIDREQRVRRRDAMLVSIEGELLAQDGVNARARRLVELVVPAVADFATVEVTERRGSSVLAARHRVPGRLPATRALRLADRAAANGGGGRAVVATAGTDGEPGIDPQLVDLGVSSYAVVPIRAPGRRLTLVLGRDTTGQRTPFVADDRDFVDSIGIRAGVALTRARRDEQEREVALQLQRSLVRDLPAGIGDGVTIGSRYLPGARELSVGGDWFDAFVVPDGRIALCVGDVVGHGLVAATSMGRLASAVRAIALSDPDPVRVIVNLERFVAQTDGARLATAAYVLLDPATRSVTYRIAGHPPPLVLAPGQAPAYLWDGRGAPLGLSDASTLTAGVATLPPGAALVLFSDGLFERRGELVDESLARLAELAQRVDCADPQTMADRIIRDSFGGRPHSDDVAIVVARLTTSAQSGSPT